MLQIVHDEDPVRLLEEAYLEARASCSEDAEGLRIALRLARLKQPASARLYDLKRRTAKALERFRAMRDAPMVRRATQKIVPMPSRKVVEMFPDSAPRISA